MTQVTEGRISDPINSKLGPLIHSWSITAGKKHSCVGESPICRSRCYAKRGFFIMPAVNRSHSNNLAFSRTGSFTAWAKMKIRYSAVRVMRIHVAGDFYDYAYVNKWIDIVSSLPSVQFFAYTRSWRQDELLHPLIQLGRLPNMALWWSMDRLTGLPPIIRKIRTAYMAIDDTDAQLAPVECDLVFRDDSNSVMKKANGIQVCPPENGVKLPCKITCTKCGICWNSADTIRDLAMSDYVLTATKELDAPLLRKPCKIRKVSVC